MQSDGGGQVGGRGTAPPQPCPFPRVLLHAPHPSSAAHAEGAASCGPGRLPAASGCERRLWVLPDLHAFSAGAHVFPQEEAVQRDGPDQEEELLHGLPHQLRVQAVLAHGAVEVTQLLQDGRHRVGVRVIYAG